MTTERPGDRLDTAKRLLLVGLLSSSLLLFGPIVLLQLLDRSPPPVVRALGFSQLSLLPAGAALRHPEALRAGVPLRYSPRLPAALQQPNLLVQPLAEEP